MSKYHLDAVQAISRVFNDVGSMLSQAHSEEKEKNGRMLMLIIQSLKFLGRQGIALRGHNESDSNFIQLLKLRSNDRKVANN